MASKYLPGSGTSSVWWVKFTHPTEGKRLRFSLQTRDTARAELLRQEIEHEVELRKLQRLEIPLPVEIAAALGSARHEKKGPTVEMLAAASPTPAQSAPATIVPTPPPVASPVPVLAVAAPLPIAEAVRFYLVYIRGQNAPHHVMGRISQLRAFFGTHLVDPILERLQDEAGEKPRKVKKREEPGQFKGTTVQEIRPADVMTFLANRRKAGQPLSPVTKGHYREMLHQFFEVLLTAGLVPVTNYHTPNPMAALPSYGNDSGRQITYLTEAQITEQLAALRDHPALEAAVMIMIYGGLRRSEALWRQVSDIRGDFETLAVANLQDEDVNRASSLKTGERNVFILPPLEQFLRRYIPTLKTPWLVPQPNNGRRWDKDNFSAALREVNEKAELSWSSMDYRHTYATQRALEGWPVFDISQQMGNSVQMVINYYAAFVRPSRLPTRAPLPGDERESP